MSRSQQVSRLRVVNTVAMATQQLLKDRLSHLHAVDAHIHVWSICRQNLICQPCHTCMKEATVPLRLSFVLLSKSEYVNDISSI